MEYESEGFIDAVDGTRLFVESDEDGTPTLVLIDGIGCDGFAWRYLHPRLSERYRLIHPHFRGHGRSAQPVDPARLGIEDLAKDVLTVLDTLDVPNAVLLSHSMGVQVALELYHQQPSRIEGLVLMCGTFGRVTTTFHGTDLLAQVLPSLIRGTHAFPGVARAVWGRVPAALAFRVACAGGELDAERIQEEDFHRYWDHASLMEPDIFLRMLERAGEHDAHGFLGEIEVPALVIAAEHDTFTPMPLAQEMAEALPNAELETIPDASHAAPVEQPDRIAERIEDFVSTRL